MQNKYQYKSPEAAAREKAHQFGQPNGNKPQTGKNAVAMREFYRWCESVATQEELQAYAMDENKPYARRKFVMALTNCAAVQDFFDLTNQTHGMPKQVIEQVEPPTIVIDLTGEVDEDDLLPDDWNGADIEQ